jgi:hypothetical protein
MKRNHNKHKIEAIQRHKKESFSSSMQKALRIAQRRTGTHTLVAHCINCSSQLLTARQGQRSITICMQCGTMTDINENVNGSTQINKREVANG